MSETIINNQELNSNRKESIKKQQQADNQDIIKLATQFEKPKQNSKQEITQQLDIHNNDENNESNDNNEQQEEGLNRNENQKTKVKESDKNDVETKLKDNPNSEKKQEQNEQDQDYARAEQQDDNNDCKFCKNIDEQIVEQQLTKEKLQEQSLKLKENISKLQELINQTVNRTKEEQKEKAKQPEIDPYEQQLINKLKKQNAIYLSYKHKLQNYQREFNIVDNQTVEKQTELENQIKMLDQEIKQYQNDNDIAKKIIQENDHMLEEAQHKEQLIALKKEAHEIKTECNELRDEGQIQQKQMIAQKEYIARLEKHLRQSLKKYGLITQSLQKATSESAIDYNFEKIAKDNYEKKRKIYNQKVELWKKKFDLTPQGEEKMKQEIQQLILKKKQQQVKFNQEIEMLNNKKEALLREKKTAMTQKKEKAKELSITKHRYAELLRYKRHNQLPPMELQSHYRSHTNVKIKDYLDPLTSRSRDTFSVQGTTENHRQTRAYRQKVQAQQKLYQTDF